MAVKKKTAARKPRIRNPVLTRARLLQATVELLAQKGADGLSIKEAAELAQVSRGVAYQHFKHRDHLLREAKTWMTERVLESIQTSDVAAPDDVLLHTARLVLQNRDAATLLMSDAIAGRELSASMRRHPKVFSHFYVSLVRVGESTGMLQDVFLRLYEHLEFEKEIRDLKERAERERAG
mgnify:CR=1 FL=1